MTVMRTMSEQIYCLDFPRHLPEPIWTGDFRCRLEDFIVEERLDLAPANRGEHLYLHIRKAGQNTRWVAKMLAEIFAVPEVAVGYAGLKDRQAVTSQWFSIHLPGLTHDSTLPDLAGMEGCELLERYWQQRKLRRGGHRGNRFIIVIRNICAAPDQLQDRLQTIRTQGVPNYFGEQRFGINGGNLHQVAGILASRRPRLRGERGGLYLSAARSWLFNLVLAARVRDGSWKRVLSGEQIPEGPLWGRGRSPASEAVARLEEPVLAPWRSWLDALEHSGLRQERRPLILRPEDFQWHWDKRNLCLEFKLSAGGYATSVLREIALLNHRNAVL